MGRMFTVCFCALAAIISLIFPLTTLAQKTTRVNVDSNGGQTNNFSVRFSVSGDGRFVAFGSDADNLTLSRN